MLEKSKSSNQINNLRIKAKEMLQKHPGFDYELPYDIADIIEELQIHQVELEVQNQELMSSRQELEDLNQEYFDLYEFAPCGYLSLNAKNIIIRINLTGTTILGYDRTKIINRSIWDVVHPTSGNALYNTFWQARISEEPQKIEIRIKNSPPRIFGFMPK